MSKLRYIFLKKLMVFFIVASLFVLFSPKGYAYETINIMGFQDVNQSINLTGEIYIDINGHYLSNFNFPFSYCVDRLNYGVLEVGKVYYGVPLSITAGSDLAKAAWLADQYTPTNNHSLGYSPDDQGTAVQLAIWNLFTGMGLDRNDPQYASYQNIFNLRDSLYNFLSTADISGIEKKYMILQLYADASLSIPVQPILTPVPLPATILLLGGGASGGCRMEKKEK